MTPEERLALERSERITMLTDFLLALVAIALAIPLLLRYRANGDPSVLFWALAFLSTAAAAVAGGIFHGTRLHVAQAVADRLWRLTVLLTIPVSLCLLLAGAFSLPTGVLRSVVIVAAVMKALAVLRLLRRTASFAVVTIDAGISLVLLALLVMGAILWGEVGREGIWTLGGVGIAVAGAAVQQKGLGEGRPFDHNDIFHLAQALACWFFYRGVTGG